MQWGAASTHHLSALRFFSGKHLKPIFNLGTDGAQEASARQPISKMVQPRKEQACRAAAVAKVVCVY